MTDKTMKRVNAVLTLSMKVEAGTISPEAAKLALAAGGFYDNVVAMVDSLETPAKVAVLPDQVAEGIDIMGHSTAEAWERLRAFDREAIAARGTPRDPASNAPPGIEAIRAVVREEFRRLVPTIDEQSAGIDWAQVDAEQAAAEDITGGPLDLELRKRDQALAKKVTAERDQWRIMHKKLVALLEDTSSLARPVNDIAALVVTYAPSTRDNVD